MQLRTSVAVMAVGLAAMFAVVTVRPATAMDPDDACASSKLKATAKRASSKLKCEAVAIKKNLDVDAECLGKAETKFSDAFDSAELKGSCASTDDAASIATEVDEFVATVVTLQKTGVVYSDCTAQQPCGSTGTCFCMAHGSGNVCVSPPTGEPCLSDAQCPGGSVCIAEVAQCTAICF